MPVRRSSKDPSKWIGCARAIGGQTKTFATEKDAKAYIKQVEAEKARRGIYINPAATPLFADAVAKYLQGEAARAKRGDVGAAQVENKRVALGQVSEILGAVRVGDLRPVHILDDVIDVLFAGAPKTGRNKAGALKGFGRWCVEREFAMLNFGDVTLPTVKKKATVKRIDMDTMTKILDHAPKRYGLAMRFAAWTGLRAGEQIALTWDHVDFENGLIHVEKARKKDKSIDDPKTRHGFRAVQMMPELERMMREWKLQQPLEQRRKNLVFPSKAGNYADVDNWRKRGLHKACDAAGADRIRWHDLRHFFASLLLFEVKEPAESVAKALGHYSVALTYEIYGHWISPPKRDQTLAEKMSEAIRRK